MVDEAWHVVADEGNPSEDHQRQHGTPPAPAERADLDQNERRATIKLRRHYAKLEFKAMKGAPFMFLSTDLPLPKLEDLRK